MRKWLMHFSRVQRLNDSNDFIASYLFLIFVLLSFFSFSHFVYYLIDGGRGGGGGERERDISVRKCRIAKMILIRIPVVRAEQYCER